jgi:hypothetical protein
MVVQAALILTERKKCRGTGREYAFHSDVRSSDAATALLAFLLFVPCCCCGSLPKMTRSSSSSCGVAWLISHVRFGGYHTTASGGSVWALISFWNFLARSLQPQRKARAGMCGVVDERGS